MADDKPSSPPGLTENTPVHVQEADVGALATENDVSEQPIASPSSRPLVSSGRRRLSSSGYSLRDEDDKTATITFSEHMSEVVGSLADTSKALSTKIQTIQSLQPFLKQVDAYLEIGSEGVGTTQQQEAESSSSVSFAQIPPFAWNPQYRKAYTVLMWLRPVVDQTSEPSFDSQDSSPQAATEKRQKVLYRLSTAEDDPSGVGICVTLGDTWTLVAAQTREADDAKSQPLLETTITAYCLPFPSTQQHNFIHLPLLLPVNAWSLVCCTHVFPYLKRPQWTLCVNGRIQGTGELNYPVLEGGHRAYMTHNTLLQNVTYGGARDYDMENDTKETKKSHDQMTASELNAPRPFVIRPIKLQVASVALHTDAVAPVLQQLLFDSGPSLSQQQYGRIVTHLPPISNDTKGTSLEGGPSVGVPLSTHEYAMSLQRMASSSSSGSKSHTSNSSGSLWFGANQAKVFSTRIVLPMVAMSGEFHDTPKVGLVQPGLATNHGSSSSSEMALHFFGNTTHVVHTLSEYLLQCNDLRLDTDLHETSQHLALHWMEQNLLSTLVMPFFLAQIPSGYSLDLQHVLYEQSLQHLFELYSNQGEWATDLILLLRDAIQYQGARPHEYVLQAGLLHVLTSTLRRTLVRAQQLQVYQYRTYNAFRKHLRESEREAPFTSAICPKTIPVSVAKACASLICACCGGASTLASSPTNNNVRRGSDLAMTAVFGMGLDLDLWGQNVAGAERVVGVVASLYQEDGDLLRVQIPVQSFLDALRVRFDKLTPDMEPMADHFATLLQAMLTSSLLNRRQIAPGEHDIMACLGVLSDCALGSVGAHVVLTSLVRLHENVELASRLARNLTMGQYHDVVAPMLLSRTVFSGERMMNQGLPEDLFYLWQYHWRLALSLFAWTTSLAGPEGEIAARSTGSLLFASALAGSLDGCLVSENHRDKNTIGALFLPAPSMAFTNLGSNRGARNENSARSYTDLLSSRLQVMMPLLPGLVASLVSHPQDVTTANETLGANRLEVLTEIFNAVSACFRRVFGGLAQSAMSQVRRTHIKGRNTAMHSSLVKAAREYVSHFLMVAVLLESHIQARERELLDTVVVFRAPKPGASRSRANSDTSWVEVSSQHFDSSTVDESLLDTSSYSSELKNSSEDDLVAKLSRCQRVVTRTLTDLILSAMKLGGGEASTIIWRSIVSTLNTSLLHGMLSFRSPEKSVDIIGDGDSTTPGVDTSEIGQAPEQHHPSVNSKERNDQLALSMLCRLTAVVLTKAQRREYDWELWNSDLCSAISRLCDMVEEKELLSKPLQSNAENHGLGLLELRNHYSPDQVLLLSALVDVMSYGREMTGWCQLVLPTPPAADLELPDDYSKPTGADSSPYDGADDEESDLVVSFPAIANSTSPPTPLPKSIHGGFVPPESPAAAAKAMLPILQPTLRVVLGCTGNVNSSVEIVVPQEGSGGSRSGDSSEDDHKIIFWKVSLLEHIATELKGTLMAAIVGLSFPNARDVALNGLASLRRASVCHHNAQDQAALDVCYALFASVVEEIRARYEGERRLREKALFDAYEDGDGDSAGSPSLKADRSEAASSREVERLILGRDLIPSSSPADDEEHGLVEEITFTSHLEGKSSEQPKRKSGSEDFVMFHEAYGEAGESVTSSQRGGADASKMGYSQYQGLGSTLEECKILMSSEATAASTSNAQMLLSLLTPYLDTWDENSAKDAAESELVELFDSNLSLGIAESQRQDSGATTTAHLLLGGSETAADAMSTFIEMAAVEKSRRSEMISLYLPSHRNSLRAYAERFCWSRHVELSQDGKPDSMDNLWERGVSDGNRDIRSRLISVPCNPQFKRFIPSYLDHSDSPETESKPASQTVPERSSNHDDGGSRRGSTEEIEISALTKHLLEAGNIEIVDITKKEQIEDEELPAMMNAEEILDASDDDDFYGDGSLGFPSQGGSDHESADGSSSDSVSGGDETNVVSSTRETTAESEESFEEMMPNGAGEKSGIASFHHNIASSPFAYPPDNSSSMLNTIHSSQAGLIEEHFDDCLHVKTEGSRQCTVFLSGTHLIIEYDGESQGLFEGEMLAVQEEAERQRMIEDLGGDGDADARDDGLHLQLERRNREIAATRPRSVRWNISEISHIYLRRYRLRDSALEMFFIPSGGSSFGGFGLFSAGTSLFLDFGTGHDGNVRRDEAANAIMRRAPPQSVKQWPDRSRQFLYEQLSRLTMGWVDGRITNFDYLLHLNMLAGRSYNDLCQYPVMPWTLSNYSSEEIPDLSDPANYRDLSKPIGALNPDRLEDFIERFETFSDPTIPPFMYGSHYSTSAGVVLHFLVRCHPFAGLHRQLQGGHFDVADRLFSSVPRTWEMCTGSSAAEVKELTPEWYCNPAFLKNANRFKLGTSQDGELLGDVTLPPWAKGSPEKFVEVMRNALESDVCSDMLPDWIDLIFGRKQQGPEAIKANNVFFYLTYYGSVDVASIEDESLRVATELQIAHFGQCPMQLFSRSHVRRVLRMCSFRKLSFYQMLSAYTQGASPSRDGEEKEDETLLVEKDINKDGSQRLFGAPLFLPFFSAPTSHWVHLNAPPPGPHAALVAVRLAGTDRVLAVDGQGIFHSFRWAWKPEVSSMEEEMMVPHTSSSGPIDKGCFVAQRELPRFRTVPRLPCVPSKRSGETSTALPAVAISKTLFAGRSVLLVLSDGDGCGAVAMQLVDPAKGIVKGEAIVPCVHSSRITCIVMDPIGTAAGHGGVGGELAMVGSADGGASLWRFMSSHYLPLRPRARLGGHRGSKVQAVALSGAIHICASLSAARCCIFSIGNGAMIRSFAPPQDTLAYPVNDDITTQTVFADTPALALSVQGFVVTVCKTTVSSKRTPSINRTVITLHLFSLEGVSLGSKALESWRGIPHTITCTPDGTAITVCSGRGVTIHRLSAITPLEFIDEWHITETEELDENMPAAFDVDFGPSIMRPVVAAAACSSGSLRLRLARYYSLE